MVNAVVIANSSLLILVKNSVVLTGSKGIPFKSRKHSSSLQRTADTVMTRSGRRQQRTQRNETGKPENHGHNLNCQYSIMVRQVCEEDGHQRQVWEGDDEGPDGVEEVEVDGVGGVPGPF